MATTSPDNIRTPDPSDPYNLVPDLAQMAGDVQTALIQRANSYKGTSAQRTSFTAAAENGAIWQDTDAPYRIWRKQGGSGGAWRGVAPLAGTESISGGANTNRTLVVPLPAGYFSSTPSITLSAQTGVPQNLIALSFTSPSASSFTIVLRYGTATTIPVSWVATPSN